MIIGYHYINSWFFIFLRRPEIKKIEDVLDSRSPVTLLSRLAFPSAAALLMTTLFAAVETSVIGNWCGEGALAIVAYYFPFQALLMAFSSAIGVGAASSISRKLGENKPDEASHIASAAFGMALLLGLIFSLISFNLPELIFFISGGSADNPLLHSSAVDYIRLMGISVFFFPVTVVTLNIIRAEGAHLNAAILIFYGLSFNFFILIASVVFSSGGIKEVALSSAFGRFVSFIIAVGYFRLHSKRLNLRFSLFIIDKKSLVEILKIGMSALVMGLSAMIVSLFLNWLLSRLGNGGELSALAVVYRTLALLLLPSWAVIQGVQPISGYFFGAGRKKELRRFLFISSLLSVGITSVLLIPLMLFPQIPVRFFSSDLNLLDFASTFLPAVLVSSLFLSLYNLYSAFFQAVGKALPAFFFPILRQIILFIPISFIFVIIGGVDRIWYAFPVADGIALLCMGSIFIYRRHHL